jgi:hypothetical protein
MFLCFNVGAFSFLCWLWGFWTGLIERVGEGLLERFWSAMVVGDVWEVWGFFWCGCDGSEFELLDMRFFHSHIPLWRKYYN